MTPTNIKRAVKKARLPGESRIAQARRLGIPYVTLERMELHGLMHRNLELRRAYWPKLGLEVS